tara:strand:- start:202 stop:1752 length:1551 start_codon:yes stop_codon:yes gene_type:complete
MEKYLNTKNLGLFTINGKEYLGEMELGNIESRLVIHLNDFHSSSSDIQYATYIQGKLLSDSKIVTFVDAALIDISDSHNLVANGNYERMQKITFDLRFIIFGNDFISDSEKCFNSIEFFIPDASTLFMYDSFDMIFSMKKENVKDILKENNKRTQSLFGISKDIADYRLGDNPTVYIDTGADILHCFDIETGVIKIKNNTSSNISPNKGFKVFNNISCIFESNEDMNFFEVLKSSHPIVNLFEIILGKRQFLCEYKISIKNDAEEPKEYQVYQVKENSNNKNFIMHPICRLVHIEDEPAESESLLNNWILRQKEWKFARSEFFEVFTRKYYSSDLLIKVANLFDIIPDSAYEKSEKISDELLQAKEKCKDIFKDLPSSSDKDSILGALGRIGKKNLRGKIRDRYSIIENSGLATLDEIDIVIANAVNCRNFFVHGSPGKFDYMENFNQIPFFINTLSFIYGASELIELGWSFKNWEPDELNFHPFSSYLINYSSNLDELKDVLSLAKERKEESKLG